MAQTKQQIRSLLDQAQIEPRRRFGQNFMIDQNMVRLVADAAQISPADTIIEVGPGTGTLTEELLARAGRVVAIEIDRDLTRLLHQRFADRPKFELIEGDALHGKHGLNPDMVRTCRLNGKDTEPPVKLVANLPYNIASPLIIELLIAGISSLTFTVQREVGERLRAQAGGDAYGPLSVMAQMLSRVDMLRILPPQVFWPAPKVESSLMHMTRDDRLGRRASIFSTFVHEIFGFRRKTMRAALRSADYDPSILEKLRIDSQWRPENLTPDQFLALFDSLGLQGK